jgi:glycosyltransferase involved in cell wall biosynthesis
MNLIIIPFHDWRKSQKEGFRTRDAHIIKSISGISSINNIIVVNRPTTHLELFYNRQNKKIKGEVVFKEGRFTMYKVDTKTYVVDFISLDVIKQVLKKHLWFIDKYANKGYLEFINKACGSLKIDEVNLISQNIFAYNLAVRVNATNKIFDAWDNFLKFPAYQYLRKNLEDGYTELSNNNFYWITNSEENVSLFKAKFGVKKIKLIKNGVKSDFVDSVHNEIPEDLLKIKRPIIGFGGKISYLLDIELINYLIEDNPDKSFVFVGQILDKHVYQNIKKDNNVFFLGDKHYDEYPQYVVNFDICIVPYNIHEGQHGGDSIKAYEYLSTGKKVVGTKGNGLLDLANYIYLANNPKEFSKELKETKNDKPKIDIKNFSWESKAQKILNILTKG